MSEEITSTVDKAFVKHYEAEVHAAYQRMGSKLRNTVRTRNDIRGNSAIFQKIGTGEAGEKARHGAVPLMNPKRETAEINLKNYYAGDWIDALDELFTSGDEKMISAQAGAYALGRKTDELIIEALESIVLKAAADEELEAQIVDSAAAKGMTKVKVLEAFEKLGESDVPDDGQRFAIVGWKQWSELLAIDEFTKSDYVGSDDLPWRGTQAKHWLGTLWMPHSGLPKGNGVRDCFWYHRTAIGHAVGKDITTDITWHGDHAAHFVNNMMSQGAGAIDINGIVKIKCKEA